MDLLLDSHTFLWFVWDDPQLSEDARSLIEEPGNRKLLSLASCWEISIKAGLRKLKLGAPADQFLKKHLALNNFELLIPNLDHVTHVESLDDHHKDPFDRLLIAQAIIEDMPIVSADVIFDKYPLQRLW